MKKFLIESIIIDKSNRDIQTGKKIEFKSGINLVTGDNESGKSSLLSFIRHGFFKAKGIDKGRIYFKIEDETEIKHYRADIQDNRTPDLRCRIFDENNNPLPADFIENIIDKKYFEQGFTIDLDDLMRIQNKDTAVLIDAVKDPSGGKLLQLLDKIRQEADKILGGNGRLTKEPAGIASEIKEINMKINELFNLEARYNSTLDEIRSLNEELEDIYKQEEYLGIEVKLKDLKDKLPDFIEQRNILLSEFNSKLMNNQETYAQIIRNAGKLEADKGIIKKNELKTEQLKSKINAEIDRLKTGFGIMADLDKIKYFNIDNSILNRIKDIEKKCTELEKELIALEQDKKNTSENLLRLKHENAALNQKQEQEKLNKKLQLIISALILMTAVCAGLCFYFNTPSAGIIAVLTALCLAAGLIKIPDYKYINDAVLKLSADISYYEEKLQNTENKIKQMKADIETLETAALELAKSGSSGLSIPPEHYIEACSIIRNLKESAEEISSLEKEAEELENETASIMNEFNSFIKETALNLPFDRIYDENIRILKQFNEKNISLKNSIDKINIQIESLQNKISALETEKAAFNGINESPLSLSEISALKQEKLNQKKDAEFRKRNLEAFEGMNDLKIQKAVLIDKYRKKIFTLAKDRMILEIAGRAKESFDKVRPDLKSARRYLEIITEGRYSDINLDLEEIESTNGSLSKKWSDLSRGTKEQLYFALRLGYASNYTKDRITGEPNGRAGLPLIIDDAFVNFDEPRTRRSLKCLIDFSHSNQVLFFTCRTAVMQEYFKELCAETGAELNICSM